LLEKKSSGPSFSSSPIVASNSSSFIYKKPLDSKSFAIFNGLNPALMLWTDLILGSSPQMKDWVSSSAPPNYTSNSSSLN
jgi:hypothetical protein